MICCFSHNEVKTVTVGGVLLSLREKQKYYISRPERQLFGQLKYENCFFQPHLKSGLAKHNAPTIQTSKI